MTRSSHRALVAAAAAALAAAALPAGDAAARPDRATGAQAPARTRAPVPRLRGEALFCRIPPGRLTLPPTRVRGLADHLRQYPAVALATAAQRRRAIALLDEIRAAVAPLDTPAAAARAGYAIRRARRRADDTTPHSLHAEHRRYSNDGRHFDPRRPEALIYASVPGEPLVLIGVMFSLPRGRPGPAVAGPIARWHFHRVCARGGKRGLTPGPDGACRPGEELGEGSEMLHVWFTGDLRSAFAIRAPLPELCRAGLLPGASCKAGARIAGM